ncbi:MAG: hypothetical protein COB24_07455 [Hyphomicrobiales bacterium]|nr:MAG: hypothetical protein COB24_07455 [Hyphomicrobiales bacterium]
MKNNKVRIITFSGVDGAGKTTILTEFSRILATKYQENIVFLRHRPSILPILSAIKHGRKKASEKTMESLPRTGGNKSKLSSYIRFFYYLTDFILGQWIVYFKYSLNGKIIIYDRYYFDFIFDSRRSNIDLSEGFVSFFYRFVFKPEMNIFLYADPDIILQRKQELDKQTIEKLTQKYVSFFNKQKNNKQYICIENIDISDTLEHIEKIYSEKIGKGENA